MAERYDFDAVAADDALLDLLAAGGDGAFELRDGADDPAIQLLAELRLAVEEIDEQPAAVLIDTETFLGRVAARNSGSGSVDPLARKIATRSLALSVAAVAALSVSGVAAAVGGDPLAPYEKVIERVVDAVSPQTSFPVDKINGLVIGKPREMAKAEKEWIAGRHKTGDLSIGGDDSVIAPTEFERSIGLTQRTVARPKPPFVLPDEKPGDVKPTEGAGKPVGTDDQTDKPVKDDKDNGKPEDKGNDKPVDPGTTPPTTTPSSEPTTPVGPPTTEPSTENPPPTPTDDPTATPSDGGNGQQGSGQGNGQGNGQNQNSDGEPQGNASPEQNDGTGNDGGTKGNTDQGGTGELDGSVTTTPSSEPTADSPIQPSAELPATTVETGATAETSEPVAQPDPAAVVRQTLAEAIKANSAAKQGKRHGKHHHAVRSAEARKVSTHARHARRERGDARKAPEIADTRLLAAVTSRSLGTVAVLGG